MDFFINEIQRKYNAKTAITWLTSGLMISSTVRAHYPGISKDRILAMQMYNQILFWCWDALNVWDIVIEDGPILSNVISGSRK